MSHKQLRNLIFILALSLAGFACGDSSVGPGADSATVNGRVESSESNKVKTSDYQTSAVEDAVVTAARVNVDGSLQTIGGAEAETNAQGEFTLDIDVDAVSESSGRIIIVAEKDGQQWKAVLAGTIESGANITLKPLNSESTGEASVFQQVVANGETDLISKADIEAFIGSRAAAELETSTETAAAFANALAAEARARAAYFANQSVQLSQQQITEINDAKDQAYSELNAQLFTAGSASAKAEAYDRFHEAIASAHVDAEVNANAYARAKEMASNLLIKNAVGLSTTARSEVRVKTALLVSLAIDQAMQARLNIANAAESSIQAAVQAGTQLRTELKAKTTATKSEIQAIFETYNDAIVEVLKQEFSANSETIVSINSEINSTAGIKATLESTIEASTSTDVIVQAYNTFYSSVRSVVDSLFSSANETEAQLIADVMILINIAN